MNSKLIVGIAVLAMVLAVMAVPAMARTDDVVFYFNTSDGSHDITVAPGAEVTIYFDADAPVNTTGGHEMSVLFDPAVVECLDVTVNESVTDWMVWGFRGVHTATDPNLSYANFDALDFSGVGPGLVRCGDLNFKAVGPGETTLYLGLYSDDIPNIDHDSMICDVPGYAKDWTVVEFTFTCAEPPTTFNKSLPAGWNLISLPLTPIDSSASAVLGNDTITYDAVRQYNATTKTFEDATTMNPGTGYFVHVTTAGDWVYEGTTVYSTSIELKAGLNMIGVLNCTKSVSDTMSSIEGDYRYVASWDALPEMQEYKVCNPSAPVAFHHFTTMSAGDGYFVSAETDCTLDVTCTS